ncbi:MAG: hypothetical protein DA328_04490 [Nitrososphaeraceae archaeon]|nr:hypothetical protein [Nitrososphaeraceae archaeon]
MKNAKQNKGTNWVSIIFYVIIGATVLGIVVYFWQRSKVKKAVEEWLKLVRKQAEENFQYYSDGNFSDLMLPNPGSANYQKIVDWLDVADKEMRSTVEGTNYANELGIWNYTWSPQTKKDWITKPYDSLPEISTTPGMPDKAHRNELKNAFVDRWVKYWTYFAESQPSELAKDPNYQKFL